MKLMSEVVSQLPETSCYICSRTKINKICHHCGQAICDKHSSSAIPKWFGIQNPEFTGLKLDNKIATESDIIHCQKCVHYYIRLYKWMLWLAMAVTVWCVMLVFLGRLLEIDNAVILGVMTLLADLLLIRWLIQTHREHYKQEILDGLPPFPVIPTVKGVTITESLHGKITLNAEGKYKSEVKPLHGELALTVKFTDDDRERLEAYLNKYHLPKSENIPFHAGFVVLEGAPNLKFDDPDPLIPERVNTIALQGTIGEQPFLISSQKETGDSNWTSSFPYTGIPPRDGKPIPLPVQIIPTLRKEGAGKGVEIVIQLSPKSSKVKSAHIDQFVLYAPHDLGGAIMQPTGVQATPDSGLEITWKDIALDSTAKRIRRESFYVRFKNKIEATTVLRGQLRMHFTDTLSKFNGVKLFYPWGRKRPNRPKVTFKQQTKVVVDFELHMNKLRVQEMMVEPESVSFKNMVPNYAIVTNLTQGINDADIYVKRVIENRPRTSKVGAHITNRYWEIAGRQYDGVYPIDFHLVLTGEEVHTRISDSKMQVDITVQALVTHDDEMREKVTSLLQTLKVIIEETLDELPSAVDISSEIEQPRPPIESATSEQIAPLLELLKKADEAFLEGRISTERYDDMRHRFKKQLSEIGYSF